MYIGLRVKFVSIEACTDRIQSMGQQQQHVGCVFAYLEDYCELGHHAHVKKPSESLPLRSFRPNQTAYSGHAFQHASRDLTDAERSTPLTPVFASPSGGWPRGPWNDATESYGTAPAPLAQPQHFNTKCQRCHYDDLLWRWRCVMCGSSRRPPERLD